MPRCSVLMCKNDSRTVNVSNGGISYHRFPREPLARARWVDATGRADWCPKPSNTICSAHFAPDHVLLTKKGYTYLSDAAVPTRNFLSYHVRTPVEAKTKSKLHEAEVTLPLERIKIEATAGPSRRRTSDPSTEASPAKTRRTAESGDDDDSDDDEESYERLSTSEKELDSMLRYEQNKIKKQTIKMKRLQNKLKRLKKTISDMEDLYAVLEEKFSIPRESIVCLRDIRVQVTELVARRQTNKQLSEVVSKLTYSPELRSFALALHYASAGAYDYVRKMFKTSLPHPRTLKHWYLKVDGDPGFTKEAFVALKRKGDASSRRRPLLAALVIDVMDLKRCVRVDGELYGCVDMGTGLCTDATGRAREVLAMSVTAINGHFKVPVAYFLTGGGVTSLQRAELAKLAIEMVHDAGVEVVALSCDGSAENVHMTSHLGCDIEKGRVTFHHPVSGEPIVAVLDPSTCLKHLSAALRNHDTLIDKDGCKVQWKYIKQLKETLQLDKKLKDPYVDFQNARVTVKLDAELFSPRIAEALQYCRKDLQLEAYADSEPTQMFVTLCNTVHDVLNSTNSHVYGYKNALDRNNAEQILEFLNMASEYITELKVGSGAGAGAPLLRNIKKCISFVDGIKQVYARVIETDILESIPLYKLSPDHLKLFFWNVKVDARCGIERDPTPKQVILAYKRVVAKIKANKSTNPSLEQISIPLSASPVDRINRLAGQELTREDEIEDDQHLEAVLETLSANSEEAVLQIAGCIAQQLIKKINCDVCAGALVTNKRTTFNIIIAKDKARLLYPAPDVVKLCKTAERFLNGFDGKKTRQMVKSEVMMAKIMQQFVDSKIFDDISYHQVGEFPESNHVTDLMKAVVERYAWVHYKIRIKRETYRDVLARLKAMWSPTPRPPPPPPPPLGAKAQ